MKLLVKFQFWDLLELILNFACSAIYEVIFFDKDHLFIFFFSLENFYFNWPEELLGLRKVFDFNLSRSLNDGLKDL